MNQLLKTLLTLIFEWLFWRVYRSWTSVRDQKRREEQIKQEVKTKVDNLKKANTEKEREDATDDIARGSF